MPLALIGKLLTAVFGSRNERLVTALNKVADQIEALEPTVSALSAEGLKAKTGELRGRLSAGEPMERVLPEALACIREASKRAKAHRHFHCQLVGGQALYRGNIAEMRTGEGKTIVCHLAAYLKVISGHKVHIVTVNDYLVKRDAEFAKPIFELLGVNVGFIQSQLDPGGYEGLRQASYGCDITYGTNNEFGFDYLRDNMKMNATAQVQGQLDFAVIDEVDSILIDEARTPLIISGPAHDEPERYRKADEIARRLIQLQDTCNKETRARIENREPLYERAYALGQVSKGRVDQACDKFAVDPAWLTEDEAGWLDHKQYFVTERERKQVHLTHVGVTAAQEAAGIGSFYVAGNMEWPHLLENALRAHVVYERDRDYVVQRTPETPEGEVIIVDEFTGRLMIGRQWSDGLHQAVEAKEGVRIKEETQTMATITLQNYFKLYQQIAGMTGTAQTEADEFMKVYRLEVVTIPTNKPMVRVDNDDKIYGTTDEKFDAVVEEIHSYHRFGHSGDAYHLSEALKGLARTAGKSADPAVAQSAARIKDMVARLDKGEAKAEEAGELYRALVGEKVGPRPILVGTTSVEKSEQLSKALTKRYGIQHEVLNAKNHAREAEIVAKAGQQYQDRAGHKFGNVTIATNMAGRGTDIILGPGVAKLGGLHVIGTERHESRRIDNQLRGRAGRQGDPGSSRFFVSLEDDLMRLFAGEWTIRMLKALGLRDGMSIEDKRISRGIARAQKKVEERNFLIRKNLLEYDEVMDRQRRAFYGQRQAILRGEGVTQLVWKILEDTLRQAVQVYLVDDYAAAGKVEFARSKFGVNLDAKDIALLDEDSLDDLIRDRAAEEARSTVAITIGEYLVDGEDPANWDYRGLATWAMQQFQVNLSISELREMQPDEIEAKLIAEAIEQIEDQDLPELAKFFDADYALASFVEYIEAKFDLRLALDELRGKLPEQVQELAVERIRAKWAERELTYPVEFACNFAFGGEQVNAYQAQWFVSWVNAKYNADWTLDTLNGKKVSEVREEVGRLHRDWMTNGKLDAEVDGALSRYQGEDLKAWATQRFGHCPALGNGDARARLIAAGRERLREELTTCERFVLLNIFDASWKDHLLAMDHLRNAIGLRSYAEKDPRVEYKKEGSRMFEEMWRNIREKVTDIVLKVRLSPDAQFQSVYRPTQLQKADSTNAGFAGAGVSAIAAATSDVQAQATRDREAAMAAQSSGKDEPARVETIRRERPILRRNDPCPCGSGKKFKKCCGEEGATPKFDLRQYDVK